MHRSRIVLTLFAACLALTGQHAFAQTKPLAEMEVHVAIDSGHVFSKQGRRGVIYSEQVRIADAPWVRLRFAEATLGEAPAGGQPTTLQITSTLDGAFQTMNAQHLVEWSNTSAYFNGDTVTVQIIADAGAGASRLVIEGAWVGLPPEGPGDDDPESICFGVDDRVLSSEAANARLLTIGCTAWLISDSANCFLTAGHCTTSSTSVCQFNVPLSNANGSLNHPPPQHQYSVDLASVQTGGGGGVGNDWKYFGCHPNSTTGLTAYQAQQAAYDLASQAPPVSGQQIRITGYGTTSSPVSPTWNQVQKTHSGPYFSQTGTTVRYQTDTTGGNSGSPVYDLSTNLAIGIHTHGGCTSTGGSNQGTAIHHAALQNALANPIGVCFPQGFTIQASPNSQTICSPADAMYTINIGQVGSQNDPVTLSANNVPAGATAAFSVNPVVPGGSSVLTIGNTGAVSPGTSSIQVVGNNGSFNHQTNVSLSVYTGAPTTATLLAPSNGASAIPVLPTLSWSAAAQAQNYLVQIASDAGFNDVVYSATVATTSHTVGSALDTLTQFFWRVRASNACGDGAFSGAFSFTTMDQPAVLLVDDDDNSPDVRSYYTAALNAMNIAYDIWDTGNTSQNEPTYGQMTPYKIIIWFSGDSFGGTGNPKAGPKAATDVALQQWLEDGGCLFLSSQDYLYDRIGSGNTTPNAYMQEYLGIATPFAHDRNYLNITGGFNVFAAFSPWTLTYSAASGGPGLSNFSDLVNPNANGLLAFTFQSATASGGGAVTRDGGKYRTTFWGFPFEAIPTAADRLGALTTFVSWCGKLNLPCLADVTGDGTVNANDLLAVINSWGPCAGCASDVTGDDQVNANDLLAVINAWGPCP